eukprot:TRINITY_DN915_c1_g1_i7.p1 TRINITY_DN915_c1_g1~~TRINITY_DN915_c1_g1_i7.p1  ORF type:complete len:734 (+),score=89.57 TRINITY_DN915_c1_g1_i7:94-2295(+)
MTTADIQQQPLDHGASLYAKWIAIWLSLLAVSSVIVGLTHKHWMACNLMAGKGYDYTLGEWVSLQSYVLFGFVGVMSSMMLVRTVAVSPLPSASRNFMLLGAVVFYSAVSTLLLLAAAPWNEGGSMGDNWNLATAAPAFITIFSLLILTLKPLYGNLVKDSASEKAPLLPQSPQRKPFFKNSTLLLAFSLLFLPTLLIACSLAPPMWRYLNEKPSYTSIAQTDAYSFKVGSIYFNVFPDVLIYYVFLYVIIIAGVVTQYSLSVFKIAHTRVEKLGNATVGSLFLSLCVIVLVLVWVLYWSHHKYAGSTVSKTENAARTFGQLAVLMMSLMLLPLPRSTIWGSVFGVSWEAGIAVHTWLGYMVFLCSFLHQVLFYFATKDFPDIWNYHFDNFTVPSVLTSWWIAFFLVLCLSANTIRRNRFEIFYFAHHFGLVFLFICILHAGSSWYFLIGGLSLWLFDRLLRFSSGTKRTTVLSVKAHGVADCAHTELCLNVPGFKFQKGQFCFLNIPEVDMLQWHPFTVSSAPHEDEVKFHIKAMLPPRNAADSFIESTAETWTAKLHRLASTETPFVVSIDGAYGTPPCYEKYSHVIFCVGGIGVTPAHSAVKSLVHDKSLKNGVPQPNIHTIWSIRHGSLIAMMDDSFSRLPPLTSEEEVTSSIFLTANHDTSPGYPNVQCCTIPEQAASCQHEFQTIASKVDTPRNVLVFTCGPPPFTNAMYELALECGFDYHTETFAL